MKILASLCAVAITLTAGISTLSAGGDKWVDGAVTYKFAGLDPHFNAPEDACKAGVDDLVKHGNKKTFDSVKPGTSSTMMTCMLKESDGSPFEQTNVITKVLECPDTTSPRSTDNSGEFAKMRCHCDDAKRGCPVAKKK
jgi:X-X-X-Leu-X-X-Gly heptad repeat protein